MAKKIPVAIWMARHIRRIEPKFHHVDRLMGAGRFRIASFGKNRRGCWVFKELVIEWWCEGSEWSGGAGA